MALAVLQAKLAHLLNQLKDLSTKKRALVQQQLALTEDEGRVLENLQLISIELRSLTHAQNQCLGAASTTIKQDPQDAYMPAPKTCATSHEHNGLKGTEPPSKKLKTQDEVCAYAIPGNVSKIQ
jgi:hypothetical protein